MKTRASIVYRGHKYRMTNIEIVKIISCTNQLRYRAPSASVFTEEFIFTLENSSMPKKKERKNMEQREAVKQMAKKRCLWCFIFGAES